MQLDFEDVFAGAFGRVILLFLFLLSAIWGGCIVGCMARTIGEISLSTLSLNTLFHLLKDLLQSPLHLINLWIVPNVGILAIAVVVLFVSESYGYGAWGIILGFESLFFMLGSGYSHWGSSQWLAWVSWGILLTMVGTGIWLVRQMRTNRWARAMAELSAENAMRRAERETQARSNPQIGLEKTEEKPD
jgi:hypothetical protein